ncbi:glycosyltransferase family 39 protein [Algibacter miyuki]|uniref:Glycosyltransferase family 39 protein n=1 Tax=Algibacter miyuki TaxID=1306933 RepID=A0ABV5GWN2_9FLAO|nr:glycosyltransferase family 39 protein [Algibacter miyuki]MDN3664284.1 glycosyltransferase family 39 protein [Algibacter miyuki]
MVKLINKYKDQLGFLVLWLLLIFIINPIGDFPLNDDWCYGKSVRTLYQDGYLKLYNWGEMTLVGHVYWGYFFTKIFGFSFTVLRWSTLVLGYATILGIYNLLKAAKLVRWMVLFGTALCVMNPIFLSLSFSFMTDVPFLCVSIWSLYLFLKALQTNRWQPIYWAVFFCFWAFLIRQLAWVFPVVWLLTVLFTKKRTVKNITQALLPLLMMVVFSLVFSYIMDSQGLLPKRYNSKFTVLLGSITNLDLGVFFRFISYFLRSVAYIGFLFAPIHIFYLNRYKFKAYHVWTIVYTVVVTAAIILAGKTIPSLDNVWIDFGVGPITLADHSGNFTTTPSPRAPVWFWQMVTAVGVFSSVALIFNLRQFIIALFNKKIISHEVVLSVMFFVVYLTPFLIVGVYDRYLLPLFPMAIVLLGANSKKNPKEMFQYCAFGFLGVLTWFSVSATHDYLSWNRVRWEALNELTDSGVSKEHIQGGAEFVTWYHFSEERERWWEIVTPVYTLVFQHEKKDQVIKTYHYRRWLPGNGDMYMIFNSVLAEEIKIKSHVRE